MVGVGAPHDRGWRPLWRGLAPLMMGGWRLSCLGVAPLVVGSLKYFTPIIAIRALFDPKET